MTTAAALPNLPAVQAEASHALVLRSVSFQRVEFDLIFEGGVRPIVVHVGSGASWSRAVRFPALDSDATASTGDDELDAVICTRAAEELARLEGAVLALRGTA